jgi:hypothetical protein
MMEHKVMCCDKEFEATMCFSSFAMYWIVLDVFFNKACWWLIGTSFSITQAMSIDMDHDALRSVEGRKGHIKELVFCGIECKTRGRCQ